MFLLFGTIANKPKTLKILMETIYHSLKSSDIPNNLENHKSNYVEFDEEKISDFILKSEKIMQEVCTYSTSKYSLKTRKIDRILTSKIYGIPIMILFLAIIFWITIAGANYPSSLLSYLFSFIQEKLLIVFTNIHIPKFLTNVLIYRYVSNCNLGYLCYASTNGNIFSLIYSS